jgi:RHS repeat-associated protein
VKYGPAADAASQKFTGQQRDMETGLDYFRARYLSGPQGRFTSPDEPLLDQFAGDPQSWNLSGYVRNSPLVYVDPTGNCSIKEGENYASDDPGSPCVEPGHTRVTVRDFAPLDPLISLMFGRIARTAGPPVNTLAIATALVTAAPATGGFGLGVKATTIPESLAMLTARIGGLAPLVFSPRVTNTKVVVNFAHQLMKVRPGHLPPPGSEAQVQQAVEGAIQTGNYVLKANGLIEGTTQINGVAVAFRGRFVDGIARIATVFTKR